MATGIFKIDIDKCTENTLINFIRANTNKGGYNSYQLNENVEDHSYLEKIVYRMAQHDISYMKSDNIDNFKVTFFTKCYKTTGNDVNMHVDFDDLEYLGIKDIPLKDLRKILDDAKDNIYLPFSNTCLDCSNKLCEERMTLVTFIWKKDDLPIIPYYSNDNVAYSIMDNDPYYLKKTDQLDRYISHVVNQNNSGNENYKLEINAKKVTIINYVDNLLTY